MNQLRRLAQRPFSTATGPAPRRRGMLGKVALAAGGSCYGYYMVHNYLDARANEVATGVPATKVPLLAGRAHDLGSSCCTASCPGTP